MKYGCIKKKYMAAACNYHVDCEKEANLLPLLCHLSSTHPERDDVMKDMTKGGVSRNDFEMDPPSMKTNSACIQPAKRTRPGTGTYLFNMDNL